ncbi:acylneuraminate cytidylyltransferase [Niveispirillum lacus]|uniref:Acylneuraminate cytidylyltransferase n=1 Tax=Niveispirillum lacus TaxID=1981099 RepID=A0A255Z6P4_9PROT|nr:acylneuraminate cytidylyltransferase family protein [Niveispirillum lacus]OYQ37148.1 acylneuraminate cytidylyltransferase [Niveispirillum lacus]
MTRIVAIVPMRHDSQRVKGKNYREFVAKPLYHYIVGTLLDCPSISEVVIDTDSPVILEEAARLFPSVRLLERPENLRDGATPMNDVLLHTTSVVPADFYLQTHSTNPLLTKASIERAIATFQEKAPAFDSLFSVTRLQTRLWDQLARPINHNAAILLRTQDLPPVYEENSCIYLFTREILARRRNRIGDRPLMFEIDEIEAQDIDIETNFLLAEQLFRLHRQSGEA